MNLLNPICNNSEICRGDLSGRPPPVRNNPARPLPVLSVENPSQTDTINRLVIPMDEARMSGEAVWPIITDTDEARDTILKRRSLRDYTVPEHVIERSVNLFGERVMPEDAVRRIIHSVREAGDQALIQWNQKIDGTRTDNLIVTRAELDSALRAVDPELRRALEFAAERIRAFHQKQPLSSWIDAGEEGSLGQLIRPVDSVGVYVPGGSAPCPLHC